MRLLLVLLLAFTLGCGSRGAVWDEPLDPLGPVVAADRLVWLVRPASVLTWLDASGPRSVDVAPHARALAPWAEGAAVIGGRGDAPVLDLVALPGGTLRRVELQAAWDRIAVSPDGLHALLFFDPEAPPVEGAPPVRNPNELGVVDLRAGTARLVTLQTESLAPQQVIFSPDGALAAVLFDNTVALIDPAAPERRIQVPLKLRDGTVLPPVTALFAPGGDFLFVRTRGGQDVLAFAIEAGPGRLDVSINFLVAPGAGALQDIAVPAGVEGAVVALYTGRVALLDAGGDTAATRSVAVPVPVDRIADLGEGRLLLYADAAGRSSDRQAIAAWEIETDRLAVDRLERPLRTAPVVVAGDAFLPQAGAVTVARAVPEPARLRLRLQGLQLAGVPVALAADPAGGVAWLGLDRRGQVPVDEPGSGAVASVAAGTLETGGLYLDAPVAAIGVVGTHVWALHDGPLGDVTLVPRDALRREAAVRWEGIFANHLFDRGEE